MLKRLAVLAAGCCIALPSVVQAAPPVSTVGVEARPVLEKYCVTCHNEKLKTANLLL